MRIAVVSHLHPSDRQPTLGIFVQRHLRELVARGVDATIVVPSPWVPPFLHGHPRWQKYPVKGGLDGSVEPPVWRIRYPEPPFRWLRPWSGLFLALVLYPALRRLRRARPFELIHAHCVTPDGLAAVLVGRLLGLPVSCTVRGSDVHSYPRRSRAFAAVTRWALSRCDSVSAVSHGLADEVEGLTGGKVQARVIYNGVDSPDEALAMTREEARAIFRIPPTAKLILFVGSLETAKGVHELLSAVGRLMDEDDNLHLMIVGDGTERIDVERWSHDAGRENRVSILGSIPHETVAVCLRASDLFVLPSHAEGLSNAVLEAMVTGVPVVTTRVGGMGEIIEDGVTGLLVSPKNDSELEGAIRRLLTSSSLRGEVGSNARRSALAGLSWERNASDYHASFTSIVRDWHEARSARA